MGTSRRCPGKYLTHRRSINALPFRGGSQRPRLHVKWSVFGSCTDFTFDVYLLLISNITGRDLELLFLCNHMLKFSVHALIVLCDKKERYTFYYLLTKPSFPYGGNDLTSLHSRKTSLDFVNTNLNCTKHSIQYSFYTFFSYFKQNFIPFFNNLHLKFTIKNNSVTSINKMTDEPAVGQSRLI